MSPSPAPTRGLAGKPPTPATRRTARWRRKFKQATLIVILIAFTGGAGTLWWAATHRAIPGQASAAGAPSDQPEGNTRWEPQPVAPCSRVELAAERVGENGNERCQRTPNLRDPQHWVEEPPGGFPNSNAAGYFPGEPCDADGERDYSPVGDHVICENGIWRVNA